MITNRIHRKTLPVVPNLLSLHPLPPWLRPHFRSGPQYNKVRFLMEKDRRSYPEELWALGAGYDIFGFYAYGGSTKLSLFDWNQAKTKQRSGFELPEIVSIHELGASTTESYKGESALKLQTSLSSSVNTGFNISSLFSSTVNTEINVNALRNSRNCYSIIQMLIPLWKFAFDPYSDTAHHLLTPEFKDALESMDPYELFRTYGTHFVSELVIGGRLHYSSSTNELNFKADVEYSIAAEASFSFALGKLGANGYARYKTAIESFNSNSESSIFSIGGDPTVVPSIGLSNDQEINRAKYESWLNSVNVNPAFMDFGSRNSLKGIWTLMSNAARKEQLNNAANEYIANIGEANSIYSDKIVDVVVIEGGSSSISAPMGYEKYPYDLNKGSGGAFIYVCYAKKSKEVIVSNNIRPIVDLMVITGKNTSTPAGYVKIPVDLNKGAGGEYIYLCKKYGQSGRHVDGIRDIVIIGGDSSTIPPPYDYTKTPVDLNKGAGGKYIYLCYTKKD